MINAELTHNPCLTVNEEIIIKFLKSTIFKSLMNLSFYAKAVHGFRLTLTNSSIQSFPMMKRLKENSLRWEFVICQLAKAIIAQC